MSTVLNAQSRDRLMMGALKTSQSTTLRRADYILSCPTTWQVDSVENLLIFSPRSMWKDSITLSIHSFKTEVLPFNLFMKNPIVDFDAKTSIAEINSLTYKIISMKHCDTCAHQNKKSEQYYSVSNQTVYILYFTSSNKLLKKYKEDIDLIFASFKLKN